MADIRDVVIFTRFTCPSCKGKVVVILNGKRVNGDSVSACCKFCKESHRLYVVSRAKGE